MMHVDVARSRGIVCPAGRVLYSGQSRLPLRCRSTGGGGDGGGGRAMAELAELAEAEADVGGG